MTTTILDMDIHTTPTTNITPYPGNPRIGDRKSILDSLTEHGQYRPLVVQRSTGHILCGNNTYRVAVEELEWEHIAVQYVDVDDDQARRILLADNRTNDLAAYDDELLAALLDDSDDLDGTGYDDTDHDALNQFLHPPDLDQVAKDVGEPRRDDGWPNITFRVPHAVKSAWNIQVSHHNDDQAAALADLLGVPYDTDA